MSLADASGGHAAVRHGRDRRGQRPSLRKALYVFQYRNYRYLWASTALSFVGMQMQQVARALLAWQLTHSYAAVGWVTLSIDNTMLMDSARPEYYGRVMSINMLAFNMMPLMAAQLGLLADRIGAGELFVISGAFVIGFMLLAALVNGQRIFGRTEEMAWRIEARADAADLAFALPTRAASVNANGLAAARLHAPVAPVSAVPSGGRNGSGFPAQTGAVQASRRLQAQPAIAEES